MQVKNILWVIIGLVLVSLLGYSVLFPLPPQTMLIRFFALGGFFLLCVSLIEGPLAVLFPKHCAQLIHPRKWVGVFAFILILLHFLLVLIYSYEFDVSYLISTPGIILGVIAFILLVPIALTSVNAVMKVMGFSRWKLLQRFVYVAFVLSFIHFILELNGWFIEIQSGGIFLNIAELLLIVLGIVTIMLQIAGFVQYRKRRAKANTENICAVETPVQEEKK